MSKFQTSLLGCSLVLLTACSGSPGGENSSAGGGAEVNDPPPDLLNVDLANAERCDFLDASTCLYPFPNNWFTVADGDMDSGRRIDFHPDSMPVNANAVGVDPGEWNRNDGFSIGPMLMTHVPNVDLAQTGAVPITDLERSFDADQPVVLINAGTGERQMIWAELDVNASSDAERALIIRVGKNLEEGTRYIAALRRLRDANGDLLVAPDAFRFYRDNVPSGEPVIENRRLDMEDIFLRLALADIGRNDLYLAWDFTTASTRNLSERMLHIRDTAFGDLGDAAPTFVITNIENFTAGQNPLISRQIEGRVTVPCYLDQPGCVAGAKFNNDGGGGPLPVQNGTALADFVCNIPRSVMDDGLNPSSVNPGRPMLHGHGLLGSSSVMNNENVQAMGEENGIVSCGGTWIGLATDDIPNIATILQDVSNFPTLADRLQQGMLHFLFIGRAMIHANGFNSHPAFQAGVGGAPLIDPAPGLFYDGNSQGGIMGAALAAFAQDYTRGVLGVPGMNYSTLLRRSVDYTPFSNVLNASYSNELERTFLYALIQMLWDRGEPNGHINHITSDPYPNTPVKTVLLHEAFGDHQVANVTSEIMSRNLGASVYQPALAPGRHSDVDPFFGLPAIPSFPFDGSALIVWDSGATTPPIENIPPTDGADPHSRPRNQVSARQQKGAFLLPDGAVIDVCGGEPCLAP